MNFRIDNPSDKRFPFKSVVSFKYISVMPQERHWGAEYRDLNEIGLGQW